MDFEIAATPTKNSPEVGKNASTAPSSPPYGLRTPDMRLPPTHKDPYLAVHLPGPRGTDKYDSRQSSLRMSLGKQIPLASPRRPTEPATVRTNWLPSTRRSRE